MTNKKSKMHMLRMRIGTGLAASRRKSYDDVIDKLSLIRWHRVKVAEYLVTKGAYVTVERKALR